jgi:hypothetical protein
MPMWGASPTPPVAGGRLGLLSHDGQIRVLYLCGESAPYAYVGSQPHVPSGGWSRWFVRSRALAQERLVVRRRGGYSGGMGIWPSRAVSAIR